MIMADAKTSEVEVGQMFARYLRYKNVHHSRELERIATNKATRESSSRTSKPRAKKKIKISSIQQGMELPATNETVPHIKSVDLNGDTSATAQTSVSINTHENPGQLQSAAKPVVEIESPKQP